MNPAEVDQKIVNDELRRIARMIRELGDALDREFEARQAKDHEVNVSEKFDPKSFIVMIRNASDVLITFLESDAGGQAMALMTGSYKEMFAVVKRFSELLGPIAVLFSVAAGLCYYDYHIHKYAVERFEIELKTVDDQVSLLEDSLRIIKEKMEKVTQDIQRFITERVSNNAEQINDKFSEIKDELAVAEIRLNATEVLLKNLKVPMANYRYSLLLRNFIVAAGFGGVVFWLFKKNYIDRHTAAVGLFAGAVPFCHSYFSLSVDIQKLLVEIKCREMSTLTLKKELEVFYVRMQTMEKKRAQASNENHPNQHTR